VKSAINISPGAWRKKSLGEVCEILAGFGFPERLQGRTEGDLPFYKVGDISEAWKRGEVFLAKANHYISYSEAREIRAKPLPENTTVFAKIGAAIALNRRAILSEPSLVDNNVMGLHPASAELDHKFLFHFVCTQKLDELSRATTVPSVRKSDIEQISIPIPPIGEQREIVAEIEKQFTRLEAGVAGVRRVQANLKRYRAAVLKAACEGKLVPTEAELARKEGRSYETGAQLLDRILTERRQKWGGKGKYKDPVKPNMANLLRLPEGWAWATVEQLSSWLPGSIQSGPFGSHLLHSEFVSEGVLAIGIDNVRDGSFSLGSEHRIKREKYSALTRFTARPGDVVVTVMATVGRVCVLPDNLEPAIITKHCYRITPAIDGITPRFLALALRADAPTRWHIFGNVRGQTRPGINGPILKAAPVALPPISEQDRIVAEVERRLSVVEEIEAVVNANIHRATRLRQSILQRAFEGDTAADGERGTFSQR
jgi:type I restriction enzyme S subunit